MGKTIICEKCGGHYDISLVRCPYCGAGYLPAEEDEYMDSMEEVRQDLEDSVNRSEKHIGKSVGLIAVGITAGAVMIILIIMLFLSLSKEKESEKNRQLKEEFLNDQQITMDLGDEP